MPLLAPDVLKIAPDPGEPASDRAPDWVAGGTPEPLRSKLVALLGTAQQSEFGNASQAWIRSCRGSAKRKAVRCAIEAGSVEPVHSPTASFAVQRPSRHSSRRFGTRLVAA